MLDDPIKGREEADSHRALPTSSGSRYRNDFRTRLQPGGRIVGISTRWSEHDVFGRLFEQEAGEGPEGWTIVHIDMEHDPETLEKLRQLMPDNEIVSLPREEGEFLDMFSEADIRRTKGTLGSRGWTALYQGWPVPKGGLMFDRNDFRIVNAAPASKNVVRSWDLAASDGPKADRTAGVKMAQVGHGDDRRWYILDIVKGRMRPQERNQVIKDTATLDGPTVMQLFEEERGSAGKSVSVQLISMIAPMPGKAKKPTGEKDVRAQGLEAQVEAGNVYLVRAPWNVAFLDEAAKFPVGRPDDQVDAAMQAFNWLAEAPRPFSMAEMNRKVYGRRD